MGRSNHSTKRLLQLIYGKGCMFKRAHIPERLSQMNIAIKGYKVFIREQRFTMKKIQKLESNLTYHHLQHRSEGGETTVSNGAVVNELAHRYLHSLPRNQEEIINDMLRDFKSDIDLKGGILIPTETDVSIVSPIEIDLTLDDDYMIIPLYDNDHEKDKKFNRAKVKRETKQLIDEAYSTEDDEYKL